MTTTLPVLGIVAKAGRHHDALTTIVGERFAWQRSARHLCVMSGQILDQSVDTPF